MSRQRYSGFQLWSYQSASYVRRTHAGKFLDDELQGGVLLRDGDRDMSLGSSELFEI